MSFKKEKKDEIILYMLEKIDKNHCCFISKVTETFGISQNTVYRYLNELIKSNVIRRLDKGKYELVKTQSYFHIDDIKNKNIYEEKIYKEEIEKYINKYSKNIQDIWNYAFSEIMNNALEHSESEEINVLLIQSMLNTTMLITDDGIGIFKKIKEFFNLSSLQDAVEELFKGKVTTDKERHSGEGIFFTSRIMDEFCILSDGKFFSHDKFHQEEIKKYGDTFLPNLREKSFGTIVMMSLSNYSKKNIADVFNEYADFEHGFVKTNIKIQNIFDRVPVSRSEAKRLSEGLYKFKTVVLDFEGIEWMGQGFADQIFRVFQNSYPDVEIVPVNMNENVNKMYHHVINNKL